MDFFIYVLGGRVSICLFCVEKFNLLGLMDYHFHFLLIRFSDRISPFSVPSSWSKNTKNIEFLKIRPGIILIDVTNLFYILWPKFDSVKDLTSFVEYRVRSYFFYRDLKKKKEWRVRELVRSFWGVKIRTVSTHSMNKVGAW